VQPDVDKSANGAFLVFVVYEPLTKFTDIKNLQV
jgi:hypothetical protein